MGWFARIDIADAWKKASRGEIGPCALAVEVAKELRNMTFPTIGAANLASDFEALVKDESCTFDDVDAVLKRLYDWGDIEHVWINRW